MVFLPGCVLAVACRLLFTVCCALFGLLIVVCTMLYVDRSLSVGCCLLFVVSGLMVVCSSLLVVCCVSFDGVRCALCAVCCLLFVVFCVLVWGCLAFAVVAA